MFILLALLLMVVWVVLFLGVKVTAVAIHLLLFFALISLILHFVRGNRASS